MAKKTLPPIVLPPVARVERNTEGGDGGPRDLTNVIDINVYRYARERLVAAQPPEPTTPRGRKGSLLREKIGETP